MFDLWSLKWERWRIRRAYAREYKQLRRKKAPPEEFSQSQFLEFVDVGAVEDRVDAIVSGRLLDAARSLDVEQPTSAQAEMWRRSQDGRLAWLSPKGRAQVRKAIDEEKARRFEAKTLWVTKFWVPLLAVLIGIIGALTGLFAILHQK